MKIPAGPFFFCVGASLSIGIAFALSSVYEVPEEERIAALVKNNPKLRNSYRKEYEDNMQNFFNNMKNKDKDQMKTFDSIMKKGVKKN